MTVTTTLLFLALTIACVQSQRPSYLGVGTGPVGRPGLANRFKTPEIEAEEEAAHLAAHQQAELAIANAGNGPLSNRFGADGTMVQGSIPVDARGDVDLVNRLNEWPRENRPFWLLNAAAIEGHRANPADASTVVQGQAPTQGQGQQNQAGDAFSTRLGTSRVDSSDFDSIEREVLVKSRPITPPPPRPSFLGPRPAQ